MVSSFPLIIFAYMYQVNIPMIYMELKDRSKMPRVLGIGTAVSAILYIFIGIFGYLTFVSNEPYDSLKPKNILEAPYPNNAVIAIG